MDTCVVGLGYIGLPTSLTLAKYGINVVGVDVNEKIVETLNSGKVYIEEPGIEELLTEVVANNKFRASKEVVKSDYFIVAVPTPNKDDEYMSCDSSYVISGINMILPYIEKGNTIIVESTIAPRVMVDEVQPLIEKAGFKVGEDVYLAHCPERVLPGKILEELVYNNRIVGGITPKCTEEAAKLYDHFVKGEVIRTESKVAEMSKLIENTYRDVNIAFANELAKICNKLDINVLEAISLANKHPRVNIHSPGPGVGGHCLAVDPYFIYAKTPETAKLIKLSRDINVSMPHYVVDNTEKLLGYDKSKKITAFGVTYKGNVDDMRESPAVEIIKLLEEKGYSVSVYDPHVEKYMADDYVGCVKDSSIVLILVDHDEFKCINAKKLLDNMKNPLVLDTRNIVKELDGVHVVNFGNLYKFSKNI
jgi:UDP-N-acetyl-D-mannosaminuronic acid dehydrogenase